MPSCSICNKTFKNLQEHITKTHQKIKIIIEDDENEIINCSYYLNDWPQIGHSIGEGNFKNPKSDKTEECFIFDFDYKIMNDEFLRVAFFPSDKSVMVEHSAPKQKKRKNDDSEDSNAFDMILLTDKQYEYKYSSNKNIN